MPISQFGCILRRMVERIEERAAALVSDELDDVAAVAGFVIEPAAHPRPCDGERERTVAAPAHLLPRRQLAVMLAAEPHDDFGRNCAQCGSPGVAETLSERFT